MPERVFQQIVSCFSFSLFLHFQKNWKCLTVNGTKKESSLSISFVFTFSIVNVWMCVCAAAAVIHMLRDSNWLYLEKESERASWIQSLLNSNWRSTIPIQSNPIHLTLGVVISERKKNPQNWTTTIKTVSVTAMNV